MVAKGRHFKDYLRKKKGVKWKDEERIKNRLEDPSKAQKGISGQQFVSAKRKIL
jgi:hypothetical protein